MKLIIAGSTGFVGREVLRQSLQMSEFTSVIALARKGVTAPDGTPAEGVKKLQSVVIDDYETYPEAVRTHFKGADACIWTVAITPTKSKAFPFDEVKRVCQTSTLAGMRAIHEAGPAKPFRFMYMSGFNTERDLTKKPSWMPEYSLMRGETENLLLAYADKHSSDNIQVCVAKPGLITQDWDVPRLAFSVLARLHSGVPNVKVYDIAAAMLQQVKDGYEKEPLMNDDLARIGQKVLSERKS